MEKQNEKQAQKHVNKHEETTANLDAATAAFFRANKPI